MRSKRGTLRVLGERQLARVVGGVGLVGEDGFISSQNAKAVALGTAAGTVAGSATNFVAGGDALGYAAAAGGSFVGSAAGVGVDKVVKNLTGTSASEAMAGLIDAGGRGLGAAVNMFTGAGVDWGHAGSSFNESTGGIVPAAMGLAGGLGGALLRLGAGGADATPPAPAPAPAPAKDVLPQHARSEQWLRDGARHDILASGNPRAEAVSDGMLDPRIQLSHDNPGMSDDTYRWAAMEKDSEELFTASAEGRLTDVDVKDVPATSAHYFFEALWDHRPQTLEEAKYAGQAFANGAATQLAYGYAPQNPIHDTDVFAMNKMG